MALAVLVVEDEYLIAEELRAFLEELGWSVVGPTPSVAASLTAIDRQPPAVAVLDMQLGQEKVTPVALALRDRGIPFVASSSFHDPTAVGGEVFRDTVNIGKPFVRERLYQALLAAIGEGSHE
jgi:two-component system, response regulator PdtaR